MAVLLPASGAVAQNAAVDAAVDAWARERLAPLEGAAEKEAVAAFVGSAPPADAPTAPPVNPFRTETPPQTFGSRYGNQLRANLSSPASPPTPPSSEPARLSSERQLSSANPLRPVETFAPSPAADSTAAREAFTKPPAPPARAFAAERPPALPSEPAGRIELTSPPVEQASVAPRSTSPPIETPPRIAPVAASAPAPVNEPRQFEPSTPRVATLPPAADAAWADPPVADRRSSEEGTGEPGSPELLGQQRASLVVEKRGPDEVRVGQRCRFVVTVRNTGTAMATGVKLIDEVPAGATLDRAEPTPDRQGSRLVWNLGELPPGGEATAQMVVTPQREGRIGSVATVTLDARASAVARATRPQIALSVSASPTVALGDEQRVVIELHNPGTGVATGVMLSEDVPQGVSHPAGAELEFEVGNLSPGQTRRLELVLTAEQAGRIVNTVAATADGDLRVEESVSFEVVAPALAVAVNGPKRRYLERPANYRVSVANPGTAGARDVRLVTHLPKGLDFVSANNLGEYDQQTHAVYWSLAELPKGQRGEVELVAMPVSAGEHTLRVEGEANGGLRAEESQRVKVEGVESLAFEVRDEHDPIAIGDEAQYDIRVVNEGTKAAAGVRVVVEAPRGMRFTGGRGETAARMAADRIEFAPLERLAPGDAVRFRVMARGEATGDHRVSVLVSSSDAPQPIRREESTRVFGDD